MYKKCDWIRRDGELRTCYDVLQELYVHNGQWYGVYALVKCFFVNTSEANGLDVNAT